MPVQGFTFNYYGAPPLSTHATLLWAGIGIACAIVGIVMAIINRRTTSKIMKAIGCVAVLGSIAIAGIIFVAHDATHWITPIFAPKSMLMSLWENYKKDYVDTTTGRTFDPTRNDITTSEGESYTMLRAVWMDDKPTFDASWTWTRKNLQHSKDHLFAWLYGKRTNGTEGILTDQNGENSASDADSDIALALAFAYSKWQDPSYLRDAIAVIQDIGDKELFVVNGHTYLAPSALIGKPPRKEIVNVSYLAPYAYRIFASLDTTHNWRSLIDTSYALLENSMASTLGENTSAWLPPDWVLVDTTTEALSPPARGTQTTDFGYDAIRVPWRIALDWQWFGDPRDKTTLSHMTFFTNVWKINHAISATYHHNGEVAENYESPATYGGTIGYFIVADPTNAAAVYQEKLASLYNPDTETWRLPLSYYDANIAWFGIALVNHALVNLFALNK